MLISKRQGLGLLAIGGFAAIGLVVWTSPSEVKVAEPVTSSFVDAFRVDGDFEPAESVKEAVDLSSTDVVLQGSVVGLSPGPGVLDGSGQAAILETAVMMVAPTEGGSPQAVLILKPAPTTAAALNGVELPAEQITVLAHRLTAAERKGFVATIDTPAVSALPELSALSPYGMMMEVDPENSSGLAVALGEPMDFSDAPTYEDVAIAAEQAIR